MCWSTEKIPIKQIAEEDVSVFKVAKTDGDKLYSFYQNFEYKKNNTYTTELCVEKTVENDECIYTINEGFHSYNNKVKAFQEKAKFYFGKESSDINYFIIEGTSKTLEFHNYFNNKVNLKKLLCHIPKGSTYYENEEGEIVSNSIVVDNIEDIEYIYNLNKKQLWQK